MSDRRRIEDRFSVLYVTAAGRSTIWSEWPTREAADEAARERVAFTGRPHWIAQLVAVAEPGAPTVADIEAVVDRIEAVLQPRGRCVECGGGEMHWKHFPGDPLVGHHEFQSAPRVEATRVADYDVDVDVAKERPVGDHRHDRRAHTARRVGHAIPTTSEREVVAKESHGRPFYYECTVPGCGLDGHKSLSDL